MPIGVRVISDYLNDRIAESSVQFDITMHYVNQAVLAERQRCAKIADSGNTGCGDQGDLAALDIAEKIRSGE